VSSRRVLYHRSRLALAKGAFLDTLITSSDPVYIFAFWLGVGVTALAVLMMALILLMRQLVLHRDRVHARAVAFWREYLVPNPDPEPAEVPRLRRQDLAGFLEVWNAVHEPLQGETTPYLARVAREVELERWLLPRLARGTFHSRLMAIIAMGHVKNPEYFHRMRQFIDDKNPTVSLCAARALMQIDPERAVSQFVPRIVSRGDWSQGSIAAILAESDAAKVSQELSGVTLQANVEIAPRLIRFLAGVSPDAASPIVREMLGSATDERVLSTCLQVMTSRDDLDAVRPLLAHQRWHVRMQAAVTLGRLGVPGDEQRLVALLGDKQWWVRYRAAQALLKLPFVGHDGLQNIKAAQTDNYARDIIQHVLKEQEMGLVSQGPA
jgi:hypothetical protein